MYLYWLQNGIKYLKDIYHDTKNKIYPFERLNDIYNLPDSDFLKYLTLTQSIPSPWKTALRYDNINNLEPPTIFSQVIKTQ